MFKNTKIKSKNMVHKKVGGCDNRFALGTSSLLDLGYKAYLIKYMIKEN